MNRNTESLVHEHRTDVRDMVAVHRAFRRELGLIPALVRAVPAGAVDRALIVAGHARMVLDGLHLHHTSEDDLLWPLLRMRIALEHPLVDRMEAQHALVARLVDQVRLVIVRWEAEARPAVATELAELFERLAAVTIEHLDDEERHVLDLVARHVSAGEWAAVGEAGVSKMRKEQVPLMFGAVLEEADAEEQRALLGALPLAIRLVMQTWGRRHYRRYINQVRGLR